jgi:hypothetical protein
MTVRTGPQYYPVANRTSYWYEDKFESTAMEVNACVLHTTEGTSVPSYGGGASAPNLTALPYFAVQRLNWYQHFQIDSSARALVNRYGGVETNTLNVVQIELVGTCNPATRDRWVEAGHVQDQSFIYWPDAPGWAMDGLAELLAWLYEEHGVPLVAPESWPAYPTSYANVGGQRMSPEAWNNFKGVCGHMHVPENDHGDPGNMKVAWLLEMAKRKLSVDVFRPVGLGAPEAIASKPAIPPFPGRKYFREGAVNGYVTQLGKQLVKKGYGRFYDVGPGPRWSDADRLNVRDFQRADKRLAGDADGYPGPLTWNLLFS